MARTGLLLLTHLHQPDQGGHLEHLADQPTAAVRQSGNRVQPPHHVQGALQPRARLIGTNLLGFWFLVFRFRFRVGRVSYVRIGPFTAGERRIFVSVIVVVSACAR